LYPLAKANGNDKYEIIKMILFIAVPFMGRIGQPKIGFSQTFVLPHTCAWAVVGVVSTNMQYELTKHW
jgi:hypothetical protein